MFTGLQPTFTDGADCHCHLGGLDKEQAQLFITHAQESGIRVIISASAQPQDWSNNLALASLTAGRGICLGIHPWYLAQNPLFPKAELEKLARLCQESPRSPLVGIGEIGLDRSPKMEKVDFSLQSQLFVQQLTWAEEYHLPAVIHIVKAHGAAWKILEHFKGKFLLHGYRGPASNAKRYLALGGELSLSPHFIMNASSEQLSELAQAIPLEKLHLESDAPDGISEPAAIGQIAQKMASSWQVNLAIFLEQTRCNTAKLFNLPSSYQTI